MSSDFPYVFSCLALAIICSSSNASPTDQKRKVEVHRNVDQTLRICNAYAWLKPLDVFHVQVSQASAPPRELTAEAPLAYKDCRDFELTLADGDKVNFMIEGQEVGTFTITKMPKGAAALMIIPQRTDGSSAAITFDSHAFTSLHTAQLAVIDTYRGNGSAALKIGEPGAKTDEQEDLRYNAVFALNPGKYEVSLDSAAGENPALAPLTLDSKATCVAMRVGLSSGDGTGAGPTSHDKFPMELVVYPRNDMASGHRVAAGMAVGQLLGKGLHLAAEAIARAKTVLRGGNDAAAV